MSNAPLTDAIVEELAPIFTRLSDQIWETPELRFRETQSAAAQLSVIKDQGFTVSEPLADMPTAFSAEWGEGGPLIGFLGEFDALAGLSQVAGVAEKRPIAEGGNGHGCGHNLLGAGAMLAAVAVRDYLRDNNLPGRVRYFGCPGEEGGSGKTFMARAGVFDDLDAAFCWHPGPFNGVFPSGSLANIQVYFRFAGRATHAAANPELGRSALDAVELMSVGVQYMREHMPSTARIHSAITVTGGTSPNVIQDHAEVLYLIRSPDQEAVQLLFERVQDVAKGAALMTGTKVEVEVDKACSSLLANRTLDHLLQNQLERLGAPVFNDADDRFARDIQATLSPDDIASCYKMYGAKMPREVPGLSRDILPLPDEGGLLPGSTDVADASRKAPLSQCFTSCHAIGTPAHSWQLVAQGQSGIAHSGMTYAAKALAGAALRLFTDADKLAEARAEFAERIGEEPYVCPIPDDVVPEIARAA